MASYSQKKALRKKRSRPPINLYQRKAMQMIRRTLAEAGYQIYPVAERFRQRKSDFVAAPRKDPQELILVQYLYGYITQLRPYVDPVRYARVKRLLAAHPECGTIQWGTQLPSDDLATGWQHYIAKRYRKQLFLFTDVALFSSSKEN